MMPDLSPEDRLRQRETVLELERRTANGEKDIKVIMSGRVPLLASGGPFIFRQLFEAVSSTYTYILADAKTRDAVIIDPVLEKVDRDVKMLKDLNLKLGPIINTHVHADHVTGSGELKRQLPGSFSVLGQYKEAAADKRVKHGDTVSFGSFELECRSTPGHTSDCMTWVLHKAGAAFTGDTLLVRGCGRTDFQGGSPESLYDSVHKHIFSLPDDFLLFPAHNYAGIPYTSVGEEKAFNPRLTKSKQDFVQIMNNLQLDLPKQFERSLRMNVKCGIED